ncbi:MAG: hypothetical protein ACRDFB_06915 [Rhabdochlamydiaceae bacterium]
MKIFQKKDGKLVELKEAKEGGKYFDLEKTIQTMVENNLGELFTGLEFVKTEYQIDDLRPDTIAFDTDRESFVIIEYKNVLNKSLIDQGFAYYQLLQEKRELFVLLYSKIKGKLLQVEDFNWDETRIIFISPYFTKYQEKASTFPGLPIELYEIKQYEDDIITLNNIEETSNNIEETSKEVSTSDARKPKIKPRIALAEYNEDDYLAGKYHNQYPTQETKNLYFKLKSVILDNFDKLEYKQKKIYAGFYSKNDGSCICTLEVLKNKIILTYSTSKKGLLPLSDFVKDVSQKGHHGVGQFQSEIEKEGDMVKALPNIGIVYEQKVSSGSFSSDNFGSSDYSTA